MRRLGLALALCLSAAWGQEQSDWERENAARLRAMQKEISVPPPPLSRAQLVALELAGRSGFRFSVDSSSVSVGGDGVVRYVIVATSASGAENVTFEGLRCSGEYRIYAVRQPDGEWGGRPGPWRAVPRDPRLGQHALARRYFCLGRDPVGATADAVAALRNGGHGAFVRGIVE